MTFIQSTILLKVVFKGAGCYSYRLPDHKFGAEDEKYYLFTP